MIWISSDPGLSSSEYHVSVGVLSRKGKLVAVSAGSSTAPFVNERKSEVAKTVTSRRTAVDSPAASLMIKSMV